jgi:hypothetical protein
VTETPQGAPSRQAYDPARIRERLAALLTKGPRKALDLLLDVLAIGAPEGFALPDLRANLTAIGATMVDPMGEKWGLASGGGEAAAAVGPAPTRAEQVRLALLAVLTRGPVVGLSYVLEALSAEGMRPAPDGAEAKQAAREIGAYIDGPRWSLPAVPHGWDWLRGHADVRLYLQRDSDGQTIAHVYPSGRWNLFSPSDSGTGEDIEEGNASSATDGQAAALAAARRAGLFASRPAAPTVTGDGGPPVLPAVTAQGGEAVVKVATAPIPSGQALASHIERMVGIREGQGDCSLARLIEANNVAVEERAFQRMHDIAKRTAEELREERANAPIPHAAVEASIAARAYAADAPLLYACWKAAVAAQQTYLAEGVSTRFSRTLNALWDVIHAADHKPTDPSQPCPSCATAERRVAAVEGTCRELDDERTELQRSLDAAIAAATRAEAKLATIGDEIDALHARWADAR